MNEDELKVATDDPKLSFETTEGRTYTASDLTAQKCCWPKGSWMMWRSKEVEIKGSVWQAKIVFPLSLLASSYIWASEASRARTRERAAKPRGDEGPFSLLPPALASLLARLSHVYFSRYPPNGELARRLVSTL